MAEAFVLDTSDWLALDEAEPGAKEVEAILADGWLEQAEVHACFVTLTELEYIRSRERDAQQATELLAFAKAQRVTWRHSDDALCSVAAKLKAAHRLSFADAFVAALAVQLDATLIHKDPEFSAPGWRDETADATGQGRNVCDGPPDVRSMRARGCGQQSGLYPSRRLPIRLRRKAPTIAPEDGKPSSRAALRTEKRGDAKPRKSIAK